MPPGVDLRDELAERVRAACATRTPLRIVGGDTKRGYGRAVTAAELAVGGHRGVLRYDPAELILTARCGTRLDEVEALLARHGQRLAFEPPSFGSAATVGGMVAAGLAGPARAARGPVRDYVLGTTLLAGDGRVLRFGGEVMKNVAGYDVSRLLAGSLGVLGVVLEASLKVLPVAAGSATLRRSIDAAAAVALLADMTQRGLPCTASFWHAGALTVRLEGSAAALAAVTPAVGGEPLAPAAARDFWRDVREQRHPFFAAASALWRLTLPAAAAGRVMHDLPQSAFEWNGAQVWLADAEPTAVAAIAHACGGDATLFRRPVDGSTGDGTDVFAPLPPALLELHRAVKRVFDPAGILNPGRMYADL
jgi:glycolate oxidase FAD binding subunit